MARLVISSLGAVGRKAVAVLGLNPPLASIVRASRWLGRRSEREAHI